MIIGKMKLFMGAVLIDEQDYRGKMDRDDILKEWKKLTVGREFKFFIHYLPRVQMTGRLNIKQYSLHVPEIPKIRKDKDIPERPQLYQQNVNNMCRKLSDEQEKIIRDNLFDGTVSEVAKKAGVDPKVVYNRRSNFRKASVVPDKKRVIVRPPSNYSNPNHYETLIQLSS